MSNVVKFFRDEERPLQMEGDAIIKLAGEITSGKPLTQAIEDLDPAEQNALFWLFDFYTRNEA